jgi:hypothetical protein
MSLGSENYPYVFFKGRVTTFRPGNRFGPHYFGGPYNDIIEGIEYGPRPLHHLVSIGNSELEIPNQLGFSLPFYYGMCYEGCRIEYKRTRLSVFEVTKLDPRESSEECPYPLYPIYLPYVPLEVNERRECAARELSDSVYQGIKDVTESEVVVVIPGNPELRVSLWGHDGDSHGIQIVFRHDIQNGITKGYSTCT